MKWPDQGIYPNISPDDYFGLKDLASGYNPVSKSLLWKFANNPKRWRDSPPVKKTDSMKWGSLVDCLTLTPDNFEKCYIVQPETYLSAGKKKDDPYVEKPWNWNSTTCKQWREDLKEGVECISTFEYREACRARDILLNNPFFKMAMDGGLTQVGLSFDFCNLKTTAMLDVLPSLSGGFGDSIWDLKTTAKLESPNHLVKIIDQFGYAVQAAMYLDVYNALSGENRSEFYFCFQESSSPYEVAVVELSSEAILAGRAWYLSAIEKWSKYLEDGICESPWDIIHQVELPKWSKTLKTK